jgi:hypothetical protein
LVLVALFAHIQSAVQAFSYCYKLNPRQQSHLNFKAYFTLQKVFAGLGTLQGRT